MNFIFGNQKGGVGKSTLAVSAANYLANDRNWPTTIIDMDYQQSISQKFDKAKVLENQEPYQVLASNLESFPLLQERVLSKTQQDAVLIDLPGKLDDDGLIAVFESAGVMVCPFSYDEFTYESTILFTVVFRRINPEAKIFFVPNRIKANVKFEIMSEVNEQLLKFGAVTSNVPDRIDFQRISTFQTPPTLTSIVKPVFESIFECLWKT